MDNDFLDKNEVLQKYGLRKDRNFKVEPQKDFIFRPSEEKA